MTTNTKTNDGELAKNSGFTIERFADFKASDLHGTTALTVIDRKTFEVRKKELESDVLMRLIYTKRMDCTFLCTPAEIYIYEDTPCLEKYLYVVIEEVA